MPASQKIALVTGASSGIGRALVKGLLREGFEVIGISKSSEKLEQAKEEIRDGRFFTYSCDVASLESTRHVSSQLKLDKKIPTFFFLNAGIAGLKAMEPTDSLDLDAHKKIFAVNYYGVLNFVTEWLEPCIENGGATFIASNSINAFFLLLQEDVLMLLQKLRLLKRLMR